MGLGRKFLPVGIFMKEGMNRARLMAKENISGKTELFMKGALSLDLEMGKAIYLLQEISNSKVYLKMIKRAELESWNWQTETLSMGCLRIAKKMASEYTT